MTKPPWRVIAVIIGTTILIGGGVYAVAPFGTSTNPDAGASAAGLSNETAPATAPAVTNPATTPAAAKPTEPASAASARTKKPSKQAAPDRKTPSSTAPAVPRVIRSGQVVGLAGRCLDVRDGLAKNGAVVQIYFCNTSLAQVWSVVDDGTLRALDRCLQVTGGPDHRRLQMNTCNGRAAQRWAVNSGLIVNPGSAECLDVLDRRWESRTPVITAGCDGSDGQSWRLGQGRTRKR